MIRIISGLFFSMFFLGGYLAFDFWNVNRMSQAGQGDGVSVGEYLSGWVSLGQLASGGDDEAAALPAELAAMMPKPPEGWTQRPTEPEDLTPFLAEGTGSDVEAYLREVVTERDGASKGMKQARFTYDKGPQRVIVELVRYPNFIFTSFGAMTIKMTLEMQSTKFGHADFMTVRGLEIAEDVLPEPVGARYFMGDVSNQIWVRVLASRTMTDEELLPFFETLHVAAMNANVIEKVAGMGEVPVIVLASVIDEETRKARMAELAAAAEAEAAAQAEANAKAAEEAAAAESAAPKEEAPKEEAAPQEGAAPEKKATEGAFDGKAGLELQGGKAFGSGNKGLGGGCKVEGGRKVCGVGD